MERLDIEWTINLAWIRMANENFGLTVTIHFSLSNLNGSKKRNRFETGHILHIIIKSPVAFLRQMGRKRRKVQ
jgi:hypothetical protein